MNTLWGGDCVEGVVCLIRTSTDRIVTALCLMYETGFYSFAQIRKASDEDIINIQPEKKRRKKVRK